MAQDWARSFYKSRAWQRCRASFIATRQTVDGGLCEHCQDKHGYIVDHIEELTPVTIQDPSVALSHDNLQFLCLDCHNKKTFAKPATRKGLRFDSDGQLVQR